MARIETYGRDPLITAFDKVIGTDKDSGKATKNYEMRDIRDYVISGLSPNGGLLKVTHVIQDTPIVGVETPEDLLNQLAVPLDVVEFELVVVTLTFNDSLDGDRLKTRKFLLNRMLVTFGVGEVDQAIANDFILIEKEDVDLMGAISNAVLSIGDAGLDIYKGYNSDKHEIRKIKSDTLEGSIDGDSVKLEIPSGIVDASTKTIVSIGDAGEDVYKGLNGDNHEVRKIKSDTLLISVDGDAIKIEQEEVDLGGVRDYYVNSGYAGVDELGTIAKPYKTIQGAMDAIIGIGSIDSPEFPNNTVRIQSGSGYTHTGDFAINGTTFFLEDGTYVISNPSNNWALDFSVFATNSINVSFIIAEGAILDLKKNGFKNHGSGLTNASSPVEGMFLSIKGEGTIYSSYEGVDVSDLQYVMFDLDGLNGNQSHLDVSNTSLYSYNQPILISNTQSFYEIKGSDILCPSSSLNPISVNLIPLNIRNTRSARIIDSKISAYGSKFSDNSSFESNNKVIVIGRGVVTDNSLDNNNANAVLISNTIIDSVCVDLFSIEDSDPSVRIEKCYTVSGLTVSGDLIDYSGSNPPLATLTLNNNIFNGGSIPSDVDLTRGNSVSVFNSLEGVLVQSIVSFADRTTASSSLPVGGMFINTNSNDVDTANHFIDIVI